MPQRDYRTLAAAILAREGRADLAINQISAVLHIHPDSAEDATHLARLLLTQVGQQRDSTGAPAPLPLQQLRGMYQRLRTFDLPRIAGATGAGRFSATEAVETRCWRLAAIGRLAILIGEPEEAVRCLQRAVFMLPPGCSANSRGEGREAAVLLALAHFLAHAGADGTASPDATMRLLAIAMQAAKGPDEVTLLQLAQSECQLRAGDTSAARKTLNGVAKMVEDAVAATMPRAQPLLRGLVARMRARCDAVENGPLAAAPAAMKAAQLLEQDGMLGGWRELGGLLRLGGAPEAAELALRWSVGRAARRSEQQTLGAFHLAAHFVSTGETGHAKEAVKALRKVAPASAAAAELAALSGAPAELLTPRAEPLTPRAEPTPAPAPAPASSKAKKKPAPAPASGPDFSGQRLDASDGQPYSFGSFQEVYGPQAEELWSIARVA